MHFTENYTVWDLETTGLDPHNDHIVEVAAIRIENGQIVETYQAILNHQISIPEEASKIHGITTELCEKEGIDPQIALESLIDIILASPMCVTHNGTRFDARFLVSEYSRLGHKNDELSKKLVSMHVDTAALYKAKKLGMKLDESRDLAAFMADALDQKVYGLKYNVGACCDDLGIDRSNITQHRALGDVTLTNEIYKKLAICH